VGYRIVRLSEELFTSLFLTGATWPSRDNFRLRVVDGLPEGAKLEAVSMDLYFNFGQVALKYSHPSWPDTQPGEAIPELHITVSQDATTEFKMWMFDKLTDDEKLQLYKDLSAKFQTVHGSGKCAFREHLSTYSLHYEAETVDDVLKLKMENEAYERRKKELQKQQCEHLNTNQISEGYLRCVDCGKTGTTERCGICNCKFCRCSDTNMR
jgi:hypothetical protein